jgi:uncharacterized integral membrane protein
VKRLVGLMIVVVLGASFVAQNNRIIPVHLLVWYFDDISESTLVVGSLLCGVMLGAGLIWRMTWRHAHPRQTVGTRTAHSQQTRQL